MSIDANIVKELRDKTGAGFMDCKKALAETNGNFEKAIEWLRTKGIAKAEKKAGRAAAEGMVSSYIHGTGKIGVLVEINSETDFVARNEKFQEFCKDIAMHIAATAPLCVKAEEIDQTLVEKERSLLKAKAIEEGKKPEFLEKIIEGQIKKWLSEKVLVEQQFVKNPDVTIGDYLKTTIASIGENIVIRRFSRFELGEGLEKRSTDFAAEVAAASNVQ